MPRPKTAFSKCSKDKPPVDSISWRLWLDKDVQSNVKDSLRLDFLKGIADGKLRPNDYVRYAIQEAAYCYHTQENYRRAIARAKEKGETAIAELVQERYDSYVSYTNELLATWHMKDPAALQPAAAQGYLNVERAISDGHPIYFVMAMAETEQYYAWLAEQLQRYVTPTNPYGFWITENTGWEDAYCLDNFINQWNAEHPGVLDFNKAVNFYRTLMFCELTFFLDVMRN